MKRTERGSRRPWNLLGLVAMTLLVILVACSHGPVPPVKDPMKGEYYTNEEIVRLPGGERERYCQALDHSVRDMKAETASLRIRTDSLAVAGESLRAQSIQLTNTLRDLQTEVRELRLRKKALTSYVVQPGDDLRKVAQTVWGDSTRWEEIYKANKGMIGKESAPLRAGSRLQIPGAQIKAESGSR